MKAWEADLAKGEEQSHVGVNALFLELLACADALPCGGNLQGIQESAYMQSLTATHTSSRHQVHHQE